MQYILSQEEFDEYQRLKVVDQREKSDAIQIYYFISSLDSLYLANWTRAAGEFPIESMTPLYRRVTEMNVASKEFLLQEWQQRCPDFYERKLAHRSEKNNGKQ